jgi:hypothetical protein
MMGKDKLHAIPAHDPVGGGELFVSELTSEDSGVTIRGRFEIPRYSKLDKDHQKFLETFLRCRGMLSRVEEELNLSYPTVRARLDGLLDALNLTPARARRRKRTRKRNARFWIN